VVLENILGGACVVKPKNAGFTLIETVVVIGILGLVVVPLLAMFGLGLTSTRDAKLLTTASFIAQERIEEVLAVAPGQRTSLHVSTQVTVTSDTRFTYTRHITNYSGGLLQVIVQVYWSEGNQSRSYKVVTIVASQ